MHEPIAGWVDGAPVGSSAVAAHLAVLGASLVGERLGLPGSLGALAGDPAREKALLTWATRAVLLERLARKEAARLGVTEVSSADNWAGRLEAAGELALEPPADADAFECYRANIHRYRVAEARKTRHVLLADPVAASRLAVAVSDARTLAELAPALSIDTGTRHRGGDLGWVERGQLAGELEDAIFSAEPGRAHGPVASPFGWHVLVVESVRPERLRTFEECRDEILNELAHERRLAAWRGWWARRVGDAIRVPPGSEEVLVPGLPGTSHRH